MQKVTLNNGIKMPILGYGVYQIPARECERCVLDAINVGYRSIDTAQVYGNEKAVGYAIRKSGVQRDELFITTKLYIPSGGYRRAVNAIEDSLRSMHLDYLDLLLMHEPFHGYHEIYRAMEEAYQSGKVRAIGVSNFNPGVFADLLESCNVIPMINQVETHVFRQQTQSQEMMKQYGTQIESWSPLAAGENHFFSNETLREIGQKYGKSNAQVGLRYLIQREIVVIPKSTQKERMIENMDVFDFTLSADDMAKIALLDKGKSLFSWY
ncbi:aldo/keto reductase [Paenibacillus sp. DMB5]|uniref:aldo/keto reductase n=1 Tax=Paenibacillus sp. DMB5 TaxID=1780103 RepID=UPI00076C4540|nr:aldo/keto reductase [Paenibacillus sp. DMB5]KUP25924.1 2,5-diketo-D-gluconic acid reductase [Paenibacillus sp. DMB5]